MNAFADQIEIDGDCVVLYRPTGPEELALVEAAGRRACPSSRSSIR